MYSEKRVSTWKLSMFIISLVILSVAVRVGADQPEFLTVNKVTESNYPDGEGLYSYDLKEYSQFMFGVWPDWDDELVDILPEEHGWDFEYSSVKNITFTAVELYARNWTAYFLNGTYEILYPEQIFRFDLIETEIDFTRTLSENETITVEIDDQSSHRYRSFAFDLIPSYTDDIGPYEGFLRVQLTVYWEFVVMIWPITPTQEPDPMMLFPILGLGLGAGMLALIFFFREDLGR